MDTVSAPFLGTDNIFEKDLHPSAAGATATTTFSSQADTQTQCVHASRQQCNNCYNKKTTAPSQLHIASRSQVEFALDVSWTSAESGAQSAKRLPLEAISNVSELRTFFRELICSAFSSTALPEYLTSGEYYKFAPAEDFSSFPGDCIDTKFKLVATLQGWEWNVAERELGGRPDPERRLLVTVAEFESEPVELEDGMEVIVTMVCYPTVSVQKSFLDEAIQRLAATVAEAGLPPSLSSGLLASSGPYDDDASSAAATRAFQLHF